jgi:hypothetical protein
MPWFSMGKIMDSISKTFPFPYTQLNWVLELLAFSEKIWIDISRFFLQQATCFRGETVTWYLKTKRVSWILFSHFVRIIILRNFGLHLRTVLPVSLLATSKLNLNIKDCLPWYKEESEFEFRVKKAFGNEKLTTIKTVLGMLKST